MSVLEIYIHWANSVLAETGSHINGADAVQGGQVVCQLIDILAPSACLVSKVKSSGSCTPIDYVNAAMDHMQKHGIRIKFPAEDITNNEIKSILDILWILILNYGIHYIGQNAFQRSVGSGKKHLLEWCMEQLGTTFDYGKSLSENLCKEDWFIKLLEKATVRHLPIEESKTEYIDSLLTEVQDRYGIRKEIVKADDIVDGTIDEHTLMIYLSLFKRRCPISNLHLRKSSYGENAAVARDRFAEKKLHQAVKPASLRSVDYERAMESSGSFHQVPGNSSAQHQSYQSDSLEDDTMYETVIENVSHIQYSRDQNKQIEAKNLESSQPVTKSVLATRPNLQRQGKVNSGSFGSFNGRDFQADSSYNGENSNTSTQLYSTQDNQKESITIKRPKDYILQWEDTIDRLSSVGIQDNIGLIPLGRSRSCDLGRLSSPDNQKPEISLSRRSRSSEILTNVELFNTHSCRLRSPLPLQKVDLIVKRLPRDMQDKAENASNFFLNANAPEVSDLLDVIQSTRGRSPSSRFQSYSPYIHDDDQTTLKTLGEPTLGSSNIQQGYATSVPHRFHSLSPRRRRTVSPVRRDDNGERGSNTMLSIYPRDRSQSPSPIKYQTLIYRTTEDNVPKYGELTSTKVDQDIEFTSDSSLASERIGGSGRMPRREAWELQRRNQTSSDLEVDSLSHEIEMLKHKVELMEVEKYERKRSLSRSGLISKISTDTGDFLGSSSSMNSRERAKSCPLLNISSQSIAQKPSPLSTLGYKSEVNLYHPSKPRSPETLLTVYTASPGVQQACIHCASRASPSVAKTDQSIHEGSQPVAKWRQLISKRWLTEAEVIELKKALAMAFVENDLLVSRLESAHDEVCDKLRHTNSVLDDCRHHLAKAQVENIEFRSSLEKERQTNIFLESRVKELEQYFSELQANNQELESELGQTTSLLNRSITQTGPAVQGLKLENAHLVSKLAEAENENDFLREDVQNLKHRHSKAMSTIEELREILTQVRKERQELFEEVAAFDRREQAAQILKIMNNYMEKGAKDEKEKERNLSKWHSQSAINDSSYATQLNAVSPNRYTQSRSVTPPPSQHELYPCDDQLVAREIYPHRKSYSSRSRSCSPRQSKSHLRDRSRSSSPPSVHYSTVDQNAKASDLEKSSFSKQYSYNDLKTRNGYRPFHNHASSVRSTSPIYSGPMSSNLFKGKAYSSSMQDLSRSPSPRPGILKGNDKLRADRSPSASHVKSKERYFTIGGNRGKSEQSLDGQSPVSRNSSLNQERPLHKKSESGEIARSIQREFDHEDQLLLALSNSSFLQNKSWFQLQSDTDDSDTGISSSMSSEHSLRTG